MNVGDYAIARSFRFSSDKLFRRRKAPYPVTERAKRLNECCPEGIIIVNDRD
jgi:hypothetical protein